MKTLSLLLATLLFSLTTQAASITINTRTINQGINKADLIGSWNSQTSVISNQSFNEFTGYRSGNNSFSHLSVNFVVGQPLTFGFEAGLDAHYGAEVYLDGSLIGKRTDDLWWSNNWGHNDVMSLLGNTLLSGGHLLELYWAEKCCDGPSSLRFTTDNTHWQSLSVANLDNTFTPLQADATSVPEPLTLWLLAIGLLALTLSNRQQYTLN